MEKTKKKNRPERIKELKNLLISNSKDSEWAKKILIELSSLQKQEANPPVELIVPVSEVKEEIDFGATRLVRTIRGILFEAKGGMSIWVDMRMTAVYQMLYHIFEYHNNPSEDKELDESYISACQYVCQAPIFASLSPTMLFSIVANILKDFNDYSTDILNQESSPETEEDIKENVSFEKAADSLGILANSPVPPEI